MYDSVNTESFKEKKTKRKAKLAKDSMSQYI